ncbi:MAG: hypothetical protein ACYDHP_10760 [Ferrimicrobium sp.]
MASLNITSRSADNTAVATRCSGMRAIVIDNDVTAALGVTVALERLGVRVVAEVSRIEDAREHPAEIVCCDLSLSRDGLVLQGAAGIAALTSQGRQVLALSSIARSTEVGDVIGAGALGFIDRETLDWADFGAAVADVGTGNRHLSRALAARLLADLHERPLPAELELDDDARGLLETLFSKGTAILHSTPGAELESSNFRIWSAWSRRAARYRLELTQRHLKMLHLFHEGANANAIAKALNISIGTVQGDQDRIKSLLFAAYGKDLKREAACRLVWQLVDGQLGWGNTLGVHN